MDADNHWVVDDLILTGSFLFTLYFFVNDVRQNPSVTAERAAVFVWSGPEVHQNRGRAPARPGPQGTERETISV